MFTFQIIHTEQELPVLSSDVFVEIIKADEMLHAANTTVSLVLVRTLEGAPQTFVVPVKHNEATSLLTVLSIKTWLASCICKKYVLDKKKHLHFFDDNTVIDVNLLYFEGCGKLLDEDYDTAAHKFIKHRCYSIGNLNLAIPLLKHVEKFDTIYGQVSEIICKYGVTDFNEYLNNTFLYQLYQIEKQGLAVDPKLLQWHWKDSTKHINASHKVHTEYNILTATGRPSNRFGGINYSALNKESGERASFVSSELSGYLVYYDYSAFHPRLIATMLDYALSYDEDIYEYLGKQLSPPISDKEEIKKLVFKLLYGGITPEYLKVDYFQRIHHFSTNLWDFFQSNGYIETPMLGRRIKKCHLTDPFPSKVFNYMLQAYESEVGSQIIGELQAYLMDKKTKLVLYQYDGFLFDYAPSDGKGVLVEIRRIMEMNHTLPLSIKVGKNFQEMIEIRT